MGYRIAVDTGGTFTDVVVADEAGQLTVGKALTTVDRTFEGFSEALANAGDVAGIAAERLLAETEMLIYGTTRSTNSIIEGKVAKTALLATEGFPRHAALPPRRQARAPQPRDGVPAALHPQAPHLRDPGADQRRRRRRARA